MFEELNMKWFKPEKFLALRLPSGDLYFGELAELTQDGQLLEMTPETEDINSILTDPNTKKIRNGFGVQIQMIRLDSESEGERTATFKYSGQFVEDQMTGVCRIEYPNGTIYSGNVQEGMREGYGKLVWPDGRMYQGFWKGNRMEGAGVYKGLIEQYEGTFINNQYVTKDGFVISPFQEISKAEDFGKLDRKGKSNRDKNLHRKNFHIKSLTSAQEIQAMGIDSFAKNRFVFLISRLNSGWNLRKVLKEWSGEKPLVLDCQQASFLYENKREEFTTFMNEFCMKLSAVMERGGQVILNFNEPSNPAHRSAFDPDMFFILNFTKELGRLLVPKEFKSPSIASTFIQGGKIHESFGIFLFADFKLEKDISNFFVTQKVSSRFQFFCNTKLGDIAILERTEQSPN